MHSPELQPDEVYARPFYNANNHQSPSEHILLFGGRTQTILYDQDRVFVVSENLSDIIFVSSFEDFIKETAFSVILCRPYIPQSKGKVKEMVRHVKKGFLAGRTYAGIESLNSAALAWLDREGYDHTSICRGQFVHRRSSDQYQLDAEV